MRRRQDALSLAAHSDRASTLPPRTHCSRLWATWPPLQSLAFAKHASPPATVAAAAMATAVNRATAAKDRARNLCIGMLRKRFEAELEQQNAARERRRHEEHSWRAQEEARRQMLAAQASACTWRYACSLDRDAAHADFVATKRERRQRESRTLWARGLCALHRQKARRCAGACAAASGSVCCVYGGRRRCKRTCCCKRKRCCATDRAGAAGAAGRVPLLCGRRGRACPCAGAGRGAQEQARVRTQMWRNAAIEDSFAIQCLFNAE